jgi:hypothetical protein
MTLPRASRSIVLTRRIDMEDNLGDFPPIRAVSFRVQQAEIGNRMSLIVAG